MRGTHPSQYRPARQLGIIPAYAGNTTMAPCAPSISRDHPRVCGEHFFRLAADKGLQGSSPRMRGTHFPTMPARLPVGIIPAYAGNTTCGSSPQQQTGDHPRVCGEHPRQRYFTTVQPGSSPRMRGTPKATIFHNRPAGIIPAYAGNTIVVWLSLRIFRDHPRVCGEH